MNVIDRSDESLHLSGVKSAQHLIHKRRYRMKRREFLKTIAITPLIGVSGCENTVAVNPNIAFDGGCKIAISNLGLENR